MPGDPLSDPISPLAEWTDPAPKSEGRDHLGMQAPSVALYATLVPGITNVTLRARYYAFYPWLADQYARHVGRADEASWIIYLRRAEALLALSSCAASATGSCDGVAGIRWAERAWRGRAPGGQLDFGSPAAPGASPHYLDARKGAFGQVYWSVLRSLGVLETVASHPVPVPTPTWGDRLAAAFAGSVGKTGGDFLFALEAGVATEDELRLIGGAFSPDAIPAKGDEAASLIALLRGPDAATADTTARNESLELVLHLATALKRAPTVDDVRWALYSGMDTQGSPVEFPSHLRARREEWLAYQANELAHVAVEAFLAELLNALSEDQPRPSSTVVAELVSSTSKEWMRATSWKTFREATTPPVDSSERSDPTSERSLAERVVRAGGGGPDRLAAAARLLATLDARWMGYEGPIARVFSPATELGARLRGTILRLLTFLRERDDLPIEMTIGELVQRWVIERHLAVALRKLRHQGKETFHFELLDGELRRRRNTGPVFTNPRLSTSIRFLLDLGLLERTSQPSSPQEGAGAV